MLIVLKGTSCPKGSKEGGQQCRQEQGDHSGNPMAGLLCNSGTSQQTQSPQIGEFSEDLPKSGGFTKPKFIPIFIRYKMIF